MKYKIYHAIEHDFFGENIPPEFPEGYEHVATVDCDSLEEAFRLTNHIVDDWRLNLGVELTDPNKPLRSTSVGDVVVTEVGRRWFCKFVGWAYF